MGTALLPVRDYVDFLNRGLAKSFTLISESEAGGIVASIVVRLQDAANFVRPSNAVSEKVLDFLGCLGSG